MSALHSPVQHGYMVLADISGYTSFLTQTELGHAQEILSDLLETVQDRLRTLLTIHKIEGDAIFAYSADSTVVRGETLLELIETTYTSFRERMKNVRRHTTCTCRACESIPMLDLKFMTHHGDFVVQNIGGTRELAGADVNLVHRLSKNHIAENTGWRAYALFSQAALDRMGVHPEGVVESAEAYEHLGETRVFTMDLHARYDALMQKRRVVVEPEEALITFSVDYDGSPPHIWSWMNDPEKRRLYSLGPHGLKFVPILRPGGRTAVGAVTHCVHGRNVAMRETVLDWKPFDYFTVEQDNSPMGILRVTHKLEPLEGGRTRAHFFLTGRMRGWPAFLGRMAIKFIFTKVFSYEAVALNARKVIAQEAEARVVEQPADQPMASPAATS
jgi:Protein of unknown function (DUF2652)